MHPVVVGIRLALPPPIARESGNQSPAKLADVPADQRATRQIRQCELSNIVQLDRE